MLYFLILPAFLVWLVVATLAVVLAKSVQSLKPAFPYVWRICLYATLGFLIGNILLVAVLSLGFVVTPEAASERNGGGVLRTALGISAILGPAIASAVGWLGGAVAGFVFTLRTKQRA